MNFSSFKTNFCFFQADGTGTIAPSMEDRFEKLKESVKATSTTTSDPQTNGNDEASGSSEDEAAGFNENLFLDEDLEGLDDELNDLDI